VSIPSNLTTITVTGEFLDSNGNPLIGSVSFAPPVDIYDAAGGAIIGRVPYVATLSPSTGAFSITLPCTDNAAMSPTNWGYTVTVNLTALSSGPYSYANVSIPHTAGNGTTVDLSQLLPPGVPTTITPNTYGQLAVSQTWAGVQSYQQAVNGTFLQANVSGDTNQRLSIDTSGKHQWGPGNAALDTDLYRSAAGVLKTDGSFVVGGTLFATSIAPIAGVSAWFNVKAAAYGAKGDGSTNDTAAINAAHAAARAAGGGVVYFPPGTYMVAPVSSTTAAIVWNNGTTGDKNIRWIGDSAGSSVIKRSSAGPILSMSGPSTDTTGATHCEYCGLEDLLLSGNNLTGALMQTYYADDLSFSRVRWANSADVAQDCAEYWDSRYYHCVFDSNGSTTANTTAPNLWLRNSAATSGFGYSADTTNNIYLLGCRFEQYKTGAIRMERGLGVNSGQPYSIYLVNTKIETANINGGPHIFVDTTARDIRVKNMHAYAGGFFSGYSTAQDVITFGPQFGCLEDILIFNATAAAVVANGVTVNAPLAGATVTLENVRGSYTGGATPTGAHINFGTNTGGFAVRNCTADNGTQFAGNTPSNATANVQTGSSATGLMSLTNATTVTGVLNSDWQLIETGGASIAFGIRTVGDTNNRFTTDASGNMSWGPGNGAVDTTLGRNAAGVLQTGQSFRAANNIVAVQNLRAGSSSSLGSDLVGGIELANATTTPTGNPSGGAVAYGVNGTPWLRDPNGAISAMISPSEFSISPTGCLGETIPRALVNSAAQAIGATTGTVYMAGVWLPAGTKISSLNWVTGSTAAGTPTHWWLGVADSGGVQRAHSVDHTTSAIAANSLVTTAMTAAYTTTYTGLYYFLLSVTATTNPTSSGIAAPTNMNVTSPLLAGVSPSAAQSAPGTDGTTTYTAPSSAGGVPYIYAT